MSRIRPRRRYAKCERASIKFRSSATNGVRRTSTTHITAGRLRIDRIAIAAAACALLALAGPTRSSAAEPASAKVTRPRNVASADALGFKRLRPSDVPLASVITETAPNSWRLFNDYATVERTYPSRRAVVHYVTMGIDAPPLNDDDGSGVADYVERVGEAADASITYYERRGFNPILPDESGPDARPDIYVSRFTPGTFGAAFPAAAAEGGAFCAVANNLDPSAGRSLGSLYGTIAHELFHLVQFSYFPPTTEPSIPTWVLEGSAAGMESRVFPDLDDIVSDLQVWPWLRAPERPITTQNYGSQLLWRYLDHRSPRLLHGYMTRLAQGPVAGRGEQALADTYSRVSGAPFAAVFHDFAVAVAEERPASVTAARVLCQRGRRARVAMFAVHYLRPSVRGGSHVLAVHLGSRTAATFMYTWASDVSGNPAASRRIPAARSDHGRTLTFRLPALLTSSLRFSNPVLILSNGSSRRSAFYQVRLD